MGTMITHPPVQVQLFLGTSIDRSVFARHLGLKRL
ncbi:hypothetical protein Enr13x_26220 [Stieleria neptunia]|uniref:Uncharacterized protein n=1 Tax=Stieleria neptunia TaxID=2527979 RepID=A0A518HPJ8_9BACT|nr:hypothetical protein Enr13x_26220 [Stieleria neptunia]